MMSQDLLGYYAGFFSRLLAKVADSLIISVIFVSVSWFASVTVMILQINLLINTLVKDNLVLQTIFGPVGAGLLGLWFICLYYVFFWSLIGQTPGMVLLGLRLVTQEGKRPPALRSILRLLGYIPSGLPLMLGFFWVLVDDQRQTWHDKFARTYVIYAWSAHRDERFLLREIRLLGFNRSAKGAEEHTNTSK